MKDLDLVVIVAIICIAATGIAAILSNNDSDETNSRLDHIEQTLNIQKESK